MICDFVNDNYEYKNVSGSLIEDKVCIFWKKHCEKLNVSSLFLLELLLRMIRYGSISLPFEHPEEVEEIVNNVLDAVKKGEKIDEN